MKKVNIFAEDDEEEECPEEEKDERLVGKGESVVRGVIGREREEDEDLGEGGEREGDEEGVEVEVFPSGFGEVPGFGLVERWVSEVERGGPEEAGQAGREEEEERREMGRYRY